MTTYTMETNLSLIPARRTQVADRDDDTTVQLLGVLELFSYWEFLCWSDRLAGLNDVTIWIQMPNRVLRLAFRGGRRPMLYYGVSVMTIRIGGGRSSILLDLTQCPPEVLRAALVQRILLIIAAAIAINTSMFPTSLNVHDEQANRKKQNAAAGKGHRYHNTDDDRMFNPVLLDEQAERINQDISAEKEHRDTATREEHGIPNTDDDTGHFQIQRNIILDLYNSINNRICGSEKPPESDTYTRKGNTYRATNRSIPFFDKSVVTSKFDRIDNEPIYNKMDASKNALSQSQKPFTKTAEGKESLTSVDKKGLEGLKMVLCDVLSEDDIFLLAEYFEITPSHLDHNESNIKTAFLGYLMEKEIIQYGDVSRIKSALLSVGLVEASQQIETFSEFQTFKSFLVNTIAEEHIKYLSFPVDQHSQDVKLDLIRYLEETNIITPRDISKLLSALADAQLNDLRDTVIEFWCANIVPVIGHSRKLITSREHFPSTKELIKREQGGKVEIPNTGVSLDIPANALNEDTEIHMTIIPNGFQDGDRLPPFSSHSAVVVELLPDKVVLSQPAELVLPHCLHFKDGAILEAKVFDSHHNQGTKPIWRERKNIRYKIRDKDCIIWIESFSWLTIKIGENTIEYKNLKLYVLYDNNSTIQTKNLEVGYHYDIPGATIEKTENEQVLKKKDFQLYNDGNPLEVNVAKSVLGTWTPKTRAKKTIAFITVATSTTYSCSFVLERCQQGDNNIIFEITQGHREEGPLECSVMLPQDHNTQPSDVMISDSLLQSIAKQLSEWKPLARELGLSETVINNHEKDCSNEKNEETVIKMLGIWKGNKGDDATCCAVMNALLKIGRKDIHDNLLKQ